MTPERWQQVKDVFNSAINYRPEERSLFISRVCSGDEALRSEVESLIASHEESGSFIDKPAFEAAASLLANEKAELSQGQTIASYEVISFLSRGGMGEVYLAEDKRLGRKVALKLLPATFTTDEDRLRRFEQEARAASALNHPTSSRSTKFGRRQTRTSSRPSLSRVKRFAFASVERRSACRKLS